LHKFFHDCKDVLGRISEKQNALPDEVGRDAGSVSALQRKHIQYLQDLQTLESQVQQVQDDSKKLQQAYAGDKAKEITNREAEVVNAWKNLQGLCEGRKQKLGDTGDLFKFFNLVRTLMLWMDDVKLQMNTSEKPRDVSGVELLMNNHQSLKAEIDAREDNFAVCFRLGKELLSRNHYASNEIKEKIVALTNQRNGMLHRWEERWEHLQLILEVYQFARDAAVAEAWLVAQEPYLLSQDLGYTIDEVENLIKKHEAFEKSANAQEERFIALERPTTFELRERERRAREDEDRKRAEQMAKKSPPKSPEKDRPDGQGSPEPTSEREQLSQRDDRPGEVGEFEAMLMRKQEWQTTTKKASNRSWDKVYVVLRDNQLLFYKDQKNFKLQPEAFFRGESPADLRAATAQIASDYTKKKHVFRLKLTSGGEYLFQARDDDEMNHWLRGIQEINQPEATGGAGPSRISQTLPASSEKKEEPKKRGFFTLKKK